MTTRAITRLKLVLLGEQERTVPAPTTCARSLGALTLLCFLLQAFTGVLLMVYYRPSAESAYYSIGAIMDEVRFGWLIRSLHHWGTDALLLLCLLHMVRVYFARAYREPRQLYWYSGVLLLVLFLALAFTGTLLPWDQYAYWSTESARHTIASIPMLGTVLLGLLWGGWQIGEEVLIRFHAFHVGVLPWIALGLVYLHLLLVGRLGTAEPGATAGARIPFFPDYVVNLLIEVLPLAALLFTVCILDPPELSQRADGLVPLVDVRSHWYLLPVSAALRALPGLTAALAVVLFFALLFCVPLLDRSGAATTRRGLLQPVLGSLVIAGWIALGVWEALR